MGNEDCDVDEAPSTFTRRTSRTGSIRRLLTSSFRRTRKIFGIERERRPELEESSSLTVEEQAECLDVVEEIEEIDEYEFSSFERDDVLRMSRISTRTISYFRHPANKDDQIFTTMKSVKEPTDCILVKYFPKDGKLHDTKCSLNSFERKRRYHQVFGLDHHAKEQLFCPLQASQIEFAFKSQTKTDLIIKVQAPNGEVSSYINPKTHEYTSFTPSNIGCGHGTWFVHVASRKGCRFKHVLTKSFHLIGQGVLFFEIDNHHQIKVVEKLWLDCLN